MNEYDEEDFDSNEMFGYPSIGTISEFKDTLTGEWIEYEFTEEGVWVEV